MDLGCPVSHGQKQWKRWTKTLHDRLIESPPPWGIAAFMGLKNSIYNIIENHQNRIKYKDIQTTIT